MLSVEEAQARLLASVQPLEIEKVSLLDALGRYLAEPVVARLTQPPFDAAAMDGYAVAGPGDPWRVIGESAAGRRFAGRLSAGEAVRIFTGAPLPDATDTVIIQEDVHRDNDLIRLTAGPPGPRANVRPAGLDFSAGQVLADHGLRMSPARIGLFAAAGCRRLPVHRRPRVALLATGDELVLPGTAPGPDQIVSSNNVLLAALLAPLAEVTDAGIARDDSKTIQRLLESLREHDVIVTIGGASVGDHDLVQPVLRDIGADIAFWKVAIRPGKPLLAGRLGRAQVIGLPGNPVSAFVCAMVFLLPMLRRMAGSRNPVPAVVRASLGSALPTGGSRAEYLRGTLDRGIARAATVQDSSLLATLARCNVLLVRAPRAAAAAVGDPIDCISIDNAPDVS